MLFTAYATIVYCGHLIQGSFTHLSVSVIPDKATGNQCYYYIVLNIFI
jgi:hypothetical protein